MRKEKRGYSKYVRPVTIILDLFSIIFFGHLILSKSLFSTYFVFFISFSWLIISLNVNFYEVFRFTKIIEIINKILKQFFLFIVFCFSFSGFYVGKTDSKTIIFYILVCMIAVSLIKFFIFISLKKFRTIFLDSNKRVIIFGNGENVKNLAELFRNKDYGIQLTETFNSVENKNVNLPTMLSFVLENNIDEIYVSLTSLSKEKINNFIEFSENNLKTIKFVPENQEIFDSNLKLDYYGYVPVLSINKTVLHEPVTKIFKRVFDFIFALFVLLLLLSWLTPLLAILIKLESKGPVFFKQGRPGIDETEFFCFKFRSMKINKTTEKEASKNDPRVTKIGRFIRKTSIDEMPQFLNVLLGDMSVVGPRPHLWSQNKAYGNKIKKYMVRHYVKPGITGLAQVRGFRGEIETDEDMINRIKYDVFYIENWSLILDLKIIAQTVINIFKGEEKAY
ncbi:MAG: exopolysaccharide biosynthesis polyprenyl glycosylphosphotransferase [Flavobacterium sp.]|jgi:putative colanic acid biosynthesis UDP-glucose lipid carrier transferase